MKGSWINLIIITLMAIVGLFIDMEIKTSLVMIIGFLFGIFLQLADLKNKK